MVSGARLPQPRLTCGHDKEVYAKIYKDYSMHAIILAAGVGQRLFGDSRSQPPKCLIEFDGKTLLKRHFEVLQAVSYTHLTLPTTPYV